MSNPEISDTEFAYLGSPSDLERFANLINEVRVRALRADASGLHKGSTLHFQLMLDHLSQASVHLHLAAQAQERESR